MRKTILSLILVLSGLSVFAQVDVKSPTATEFVKYQRIPVSYFNGLPSINIPLYTAQIKDLELPLSLNYYASGVKVNQYPTYVGLGWNLNAGGCITRVINGRADETINQDQKDITGIGMSGGDLDPGYYYSSCYLDQDNWASEQRLIDYINAETFVTYDWEPDEFIVNAYGINGSFYFYRDRDKKMHVRIKSCNGEKFTVSTPIIKNDPEPIKFHSLHAEKDLQSYRIYRLFYEFTITNTCDSYASFNVNLEVLNTTTLTNNDAVKVMISSKTGATETEINTNLLSSYKTTTKTLDNAQTAFNLTTGYLNAKESKTYTLRLWLDENVDMNTKGVQNAKFSSKVVVTASYMEAVEGKDVLSYVKKNADSSSDEVYTVPGISSDTCTYTLAYDGTTDNNLRYVGANPCNYVTFNG